MAKDVQEILSGLEQFLVIISTAALNYDELDPTGFANEIIKECDMKNLPWQDNETYAPNIVHIFVPPGKPRKIQELETIFNSINFLEYIYYYIEARGYKLFDFLRVELDVLPGMPQTHGA